MEDLDQTLNFQEFYDATERLLQTLTIEQRYKLFYQRKSGKPADTNLTFAVSAL